MSLFNDLHNSFVEMKKLPDDPSGLQMSTRTLDSLIDEIPGATSPELTYCGFAIVVDQTVPYGQFRWVYGR